MKSQAGTAETSTGFGTAVLLSGIALWTLQFVFGIFSSWGWALAVGTLWAVLGTLLLFPDVRLYTGARSPAEAYHESADN